MVKGKKTIKGGSNAPLNFIELERERDGIKKEFPISQALELLKKNKKGLQGWIIAGTKYIFKDNEIIRCRSNKTNQKSKEKG